MKRFELVEGGSSKFWEVEAKESTLTVRFGRIGTKGQTQEKSFASEAAAIAERDKLIRDKTKKGYRAVDANDEANDDKSETEAVVAKVSAPAKARSKPKPQTPEEGWLDAGNGYLLGFEDGKIRCKNAKGQLLSSVPKDVKETPAFEQLDNVREFLAQHERECVEVVESWMLRSLPTPLGVLMAVWPDAAWRKALENAIVVPEGAPERGGFFRGVDPARGIGVVDRDGETVWLDVQSIEIPHPIALPALDDLRSLATELSLVQGIPQLFREVFEKPRNVDANATTESSLSGAKFQQLNHALSTCRKHGFRVSGGSAICKIWELDATRKLRAQEARYWIGSDDPMSEAYTGDLVWVDEHERSIPLSEVGRVAYSEGMRMANAIYAARFVEKEAANG
ncbi:MAG: WGR domain-containing protein [Myxococcota bacterium]